MLSGEKTSNPAMNFGDIEHQNARSKFQDGLNWLEAQLDPIMALMKSELHPDSDF